MKVFISWSGDLSRGIAELLKDWIEQCIQSVEVFFSSDDIEKGERWDSRLTNELNASNFGIVCLTAENINAPWIHFEAGALSKKLDSRVGTLIIDTKISDIKGPLSTFQATKLEENDMLKLLSSINSAQENALTEEKLKNSFKAFWPEFIKKAKALCEKHSVASTEKKSEARIDVESALEEILQLTRMQTSILKDPKTLVPPEYLDVFINRDSSRVEEIYEYLYDYVRQIYAHLPIEELTAFANTYMFNALERALQKITRKSIKWDRRFYELFNDIYSTIKKANLNE